MKYLNKFSSLVTGLQGQKATKRVEKLAELGEIQNEREYNQKLQELLSEISGAEFEPTYKYKPLEAGVSSSEEFNTIIDLIEDDLDVAFVELSNIFAVILAHSKLYKDKMIQEIYATVEELAKESQRLQIVADPDNAFDNVFLNTFAGDSFFLSRQDRYAAELLFDSRLDTRILDENLAYVNIDEETLSLPLSTRQNLFFAEAVLLNTETTGSDYDIQLQDSEIQTLVNPESEKNWAYNILKTTELNNGAKLGILMDLGDKRIINNMSIHPVSDFPIFLEKIEYENVFGEYNDLPNTSLFNTIIQKPRTIGFNDIIAKKLRFTFSQSSSTLFSYDLNQPAITFDDLKRNTSLKANAQSFRDQLTREVEDPSLTSLLPISQNLEPNLQVLYQYVFALKSLSAGLNLYRDRGYFVSKAYSQPSCGLAALEVSEINPEYFNEESGTTARIGSFEYTITKKDYNGAGTLIGTTSFPVLPIGQSQIEERLLFGATRKIIPLRFLGHLSNGDGSAIEIYRNNVLLDRGTDWRFFERDDDLDDADPNLKLDLDETYIEILNSDDVIRNGIYTAKYSPSYIQEPLQVYPATERADYLSTNVTEHSIEIGADRIDRSDLFLKVNIRNNSFFGNRTPKLESYSLLTSAVDTSKFVRI